MSSIQRSLFQLWSRRAMLHTVKIVRMIGQRQLIESIYNSETIIDRIAAFKLLNLSSLPTTDLPSICNPSYLRQMKAKDIIDFVKDNNIGQNVRILHALTHIQYNAFMSYADTILRFGPALNNPSQFIEDMQRVAIEQASHFVMLQNRLEQLGHFYGALPVIPRLSNAINETMNSPLNRIAVISLLHEGKGVKSVRKLLGQLEMMKDSRSAQIVKVIQREEAGHYELGWKWFLRVCREQGKDEEQQITQLNRDFKSNLELPSNYQIRFLSS